jgi:uncharacterized membrane protein
MTGVKVHKTHKKERNMCLKCKYLKAVFNLIYFIIFVIGVEVIVPNSWATIESGTLGDIFLNSVISAIVLYLYIIVGNYLWNNTKKAFNPPMSRSARSCWAWMFWC